MILVDTHILLWHFIEPRKLSQRAATAIARAETVFVSAQTFFEIAQLVRRGLIRLDRDLFRWIADVHADERFEEAPVRSVVAASAGLLGSAFPGDPTDRLIYATARDMTIPLVSKDQQIREFAREQRDVRVIW